jgi:hypothetical protein
MLCYIPRLALNSLCSPVWPQTQNHSAIRKMQIKTIVKHFISYILAKIKKSDAAGFEEDVDKWKLYNVAS